jgi:hypothetical protein
MTLQKIKEQIEKEWKNSDYRHLIKEPKFNSFHLMQLQVSWLIGQIIKARLTIEKLKEMIRIIPCTCDEAYRSRGLTAPDCPRCNYVDEDLINGISADFQEIADKEFCNII